MTWQQALIMGRKTSTESNILSIDDISKLFKGRNLAFVSTLSDDGSPHITPVWSDIYEDKNILMNTSETSAKKRHIDKDPGIAISIVAQYNPYNMVSIKGKVIEQTTAGADEHLRKLAQKYLGFGKYYYKKPTNKRIILKVKPDKIMGLSPHPAFFFLHTRHLTSKNKDNQNIKSTLGSNDLYF
ncbi:MAG: TIGR03618 family F420-dependent PPOX class oxidoreductase [Candidatus Nitrosocosmicus sp.]